MLAPNRLKLPDTTNCATGCLQISDKNAEKMTNMQENMINMQENVIICKKILQICGKYVKYAWSM
jgi:hypothetical protein